VTCSEPPPGPQLAVGSASICFDGTAQSGEPSLRESVALAWAVVLSRIVSGAEAFAVASLDQRASHAELTPAVLVRRSPPLAEDLTVAAALAALRATPLVADPAPDACLVLRRADAAGSPLGELAWDCARVLDTERWPHEGAVSLHLHRRPSFFDGQVCSALMDALLCVLAQLCEPARRLSELSLVDEAERHYQVVVWNQTARAVAAGPRIESGFEAQVAVRPDAVAVEDARETLTFGQLDARAGRIARALAERGVGPGDRVAVLVERGAGLVAALLGVCKSGAAYVPFDPRYPDTRLQLMWRDAGCKIVLGEHGSAARCGAFADEDEQVLLDDVWLHGPSEAPIHDGCAEDLAYVIYTSGSTGTPNGVAMSHRAVVNTLDWVNRSYEVGPGDRLLFVTSPCFDLSVYDVFGVLAAGATVVVAATAELSDPRALATALSVRRITLWDSAPAAFQLVLSASDAELGGLPLRLVMLSGDWVPLAMAKRIRSALPGARLEVLGGATEAAIWSNAYTVSSIEPGWRSIPYGRPIQNAQYFVLDEHMRLLPRGVPGNLYIGGVCLADGYVERAELTRQRFVASPFAEKEPWGAPAFLYRTGDFVCFLPDGNLEFLGRSDHQLKVRGYRIELAEVESTLASLAGVREAVVAPYTDPLGNLALCAYVVLEAGEDAKPTRLRSALAEVLPPHMVPGRLLVLDALPVSSNGKVDRKALLEASAGSTAAQPGGEGPSTPTERLVHTLWSRVLGRADFGRHDSFFDLGGQSLAVAALIRELELEHGLTVDLAAFLATPTAAGMARAVRPRAELVHLASHVYARPSDQSGPAWLVVGGGPFVLLQQTLAEALPGRGPVFFVWSPPGRAGRLRTSFLLRRQASLLRRHGLGSAIKVLVLSGAEQHAERLAARLAASGVGVSALVRVDAAPSAGTGPAPTLEVRCGAPQLEQMAPGVLRYPGGHLAFLADGAGSRVLAAIGQFGEE
jgi:amino acid adenylation domain-containing protein